MARVVPRTSLVFQQEPLALFFTYDSYDNCGCFV
jgi:hypothetical protein